MPGRFPYTKLAKYPHMRKEDILIWERFLFRYPIAYQTVDYDLRVGEGRAVVAPIEPEFEADLKLLTQKRIDVVGYFADQIDIIEVKPRAAAGAIGQVLSYEHLYREASPATTNLRKVIITDRMDDDSKKVAKEFGVEVREV